MINRRQFVGIAAGAGTSLVLTPQLLRALQQLDGTLIQRAIPSSGEKLPVIGLTLANHASCADQAALKEVLKALVDNGGRLLDTFHGNTQSDEITAKLATELGIQNKLFWSARVSPPGPPQPGPASARAQIEESLARYKVPKLDLVMVNANADPTHFEVMKEMKKEGRVRYIGVSSFGKELFPQLESLMRSEQIDFIGTRYALDYRHAEEKILPLAQERKIGVLTYFPFGGNGGMSCVASGLGLFARVGDRPLPNWAADFDAKSWAQFFAKYVVSHPAVTVVRGGTTKAKHMIDNIGGGIGRLPDEATRKRMAALIDSFPEPKPKLPPEVEAARAPGISLSAAILDRYVGEYKTASGFTATFRRDGDRLFVKPGNNPEAPLNARSETRFQDPRGPIFEFQLDAQGKVTGAVLEQGGQKTPLERK
ncbi:MAG TPA: aldo/keto reductase [Gemmatimonadaceae bacterium]